MRSVFFPLLISAALVTAPGCRRPAPAAGPRAPEITTYQARGVLQKIDAPARRAVIAHEEIPGYMAAMTMEFDLGENAAFGELARGDVVAFQLSVGPAHGWIDRLTKVGHTILADAAPPVPLAGDALPDCALTDERGQAFQLGALRGRAFAFTFIYTSCPFPDFCPLLAHRFAETQRLLSSTDGSAGWQLLSITIDPARDRPAELAAYARRVGAEPGCWRFATGEPGAIEKLGAHFGIAIVREGAVLNHNLRTVVVDAQGRVRKIFSGNQWTGVELAAELRRVRPLNPPADASGDPAAEQQAQPCTAYPQHGP